MNKKTLMEIDKVGCTYYVRKGRVKMRAVTVLQEISLSLYEGEILGIIGRNGAGKSTLLRILARIMCPNSGKIYTKPGLNISLLTLNLGFSPELTGKENALLGSMYMGYTKKEAEARLERILSFAELGDWINEPIRTFSTGMQARLGFSVAIEMEPDVLLIDEVLSVGDEYFQDKSSQALTAKMHNGQTSILVSHDLASIKKMCTRVIWLEKGNIFRDGDPCSVTEEYQQAALHGH